MGRPGGFAVIINPTNRRNDRGLAEQMEGD
jgi:hypothetical protein